MDKCFMNEAMELQMKTALKEVTTNFLSQVNPNRVILTEELQKEIKKIAVYITYMRASAEIDQYTNTLRNDVYPEEPTRILKQLKSNCRLHCATRRATCTTGPCSRRR